jgi:hypothetical protein
MLLYIYYTLVYMWRARHTQASPRKGSQRLPLRYICVLILGVLVYMWRARPTQASPKDLNGYLLATYVSSF